MFESVDEVFVVGLIVGVFRDKCMEVECWRKELKV